MSRPLNNLLKITELLRKDSAINNSIDAVEQLSLLLIVKFLCDYEQVDLSRDGNRISFEDFLYKERNKIEFHTLRELISRKAYYSSCFKILSSESWVTIENLLELIPFRVRSSKILERISYILAKIDVFDSLNEDFDEVLSLMVSDSKASGAFYSPKPLIDALVKVCKPSPEERIYDPAMGTGRSFIAINEYISSEYPLKLNVTGNDISPFACLVGTLNLLLNNIDISNISLSDSLLGESTAKYDFIISAFPFGVANDFTKYEYAYNGYQGSLEAMFLQHTMDKLAINGHAAVVVPEGLLFSSANHMISLRHKLLTKFNLHTILSLPQGSLAPYTNIKVSVLFFDNNNSEKDILLYRIPARTNFKKSLPLRCDDFLPFISLFEKRENSERSMLLPKKSFLENESYILSRSFYKEEKFHFDKVKMIEELHSDESIMTQSIKGYIETVSKETDVTFSIFRTVGSIGKLRSGDNLNKSELSENGEYAVYGGNGTIGRYDKPNRSGNTIIIGKVGLYCGNVHFSKEPFWLTSNAVSLEITDESNVFVPYLVHLLKSLDLNKLATGAVQKFISIKQMNNIKLSLPTYEKQVELSKWFDDLEKSKTSIQKLLSSFSEELGVMTKNSIAEKALKH